MTNWDENVSLALQLIPYELLNTLYMVVVSTIFAFIIGLPLGIFLGMTDKGGLSPMPTANRFLGTLVNIGRSIPFAILIIAIIPFTRWIVGTSIGTTAAIVPLTLAAAPFVARLVESALKEIDPAIVDAARVMGSTHSQIIKKVLIPEALPLLITGVTLTVVNLIGYSAMAGLVGGGGLGKVAIQYGYQRFNGFLMLITLIILVILVEIVQWIGKWSVEVVLKRRGKLS